MLSPITITSVVLVLMLSPAAAQSTRDEATSAKASIRLAQQIYTCKGVVHGTVKVPVCCVKGERAGCVVGVPECKSLGGTPSSSGHKDCNRPVSSGVPASL